MGKKSREKREKKELNLRGGGEKSYYQTGLEKAFIFIIRWSTYLVLFAPLIVNKHFFFPFVAPKTFFFRIVVEVMAAAYLLLVFINRKYRPRVNALNIALALFLVVFIVASIAGINFSRSFWSTYERMTGVFTMLHLFAFFIILTSVFKKRADWEKFLGVSIIVGVLLSLYVLKGSEVSTRGGGTIGNTSFMAAYLLFDIFFAIILFLSKRRWWQLFAGASLLIMLPVLFTSTARGAIISFSVGIVIFFLAYLIFSGHKKLRNSGIALILLIAIGGVFLAVVQPQIIKDEAQKLRWEMNSRFVVWEKGWKGFLEKPILGWGPENFNVVFLKYFNPCMSLSECGSEVWFDRTHNIVLDTLVTTGIIGLLSYLALFMVVIYSLFRVASRVVDKRNIFIPLGLIVLLLVYFAQNLLVFDMINTYLVFFLTLGFADFLTSKREGGGFEVEYDRRRLKPLAAGLIVVPIAFFFWWGNIDPLIANHYIIKSVSSTNVEDAVECFQKSVDTPMEKYEAREQFSQRLIRFNRQLTDLSEREKTIFSDVYGIVENEMEKSIQENPLDFRHHLFAGELYLASFRISGNTEKLKRAEEILEEAVKLSPTNQQGWWQLAEVQVSQGEIDKAISYLKKAVELEPRVGRSHWYLAMGYRIKGDYQAALEEAKEARKQGYNWMQNPNELEQVMVILQGLGVDPYEAITEYDQDLVEGFRKMVKNDPQNYKAWMNLAAGYANLKEYDKAREAAKKVMEIRPEMTQEVNQFLNSLPEE